MRKSGLPILKVPFQMDQNNLIGIPFTNKLPIIKLSVSDLEVN